MNSQATMCEDVVWKRENLEVHTDRRNIKMVSILGGLKKISWHGPCAFFYKGILLLFPYFT